MSTQGFEFNRVTFGLPVASYRVDAYITRDERLPVVTEYVLRLLRVCGSVTLAGLRNFFGFTDAEALAPDKHSAPQNKRLIPRHRRRPTVP